MRTEKNNDFIKFLRFGITGGINTLVDFFVYSVVLYYGAGIYFAQVAGYSLGTLNSYCINRRWTFQSEKRFFSSELFKFVAANVVTLLLSLVMLQLLTNIVPQTICFGDKDISKLVIKIPLVAFTVLVNFVLSRFWVFH